MHSSIDLFSIVLAVVLLGGGYTLFGSLFGSTSLKEYRPPPKNYKEVRKRREEREQRIKLEYEEKKALKLKARNEKNKNYEEKKENKKREIEKVAETKRIAKEEKKRIAKENKKDFFSWLKPTEKTTHYKNTTIEENSINEKMDNLIKELKDL